ncbi:protein-tyrosine-phosphatase [Cytophaga hutchinsonii]|jgi:arsenate reductase|uniref:Protein-tyrosine-phosphatase n=1 Tax=Cytophaga hutchinsonii (strain ATCC 33406 / DSM 1761 / CIP 103989 / NBRC 15051 / NCIMB 9469 / D465) TaxID=269798 RepID=A0A6N4SR63_CYTH3|nr:protein-tyrosine-phosphatase [Cytophaga hutchinsonii]ABG58786.1 protein-tyrosine-phosphatase [Cytophaga hutchinsonii ATCC 33406]SFX61807.1 protein-tyrosine phosphatase [Cytophaga hutchinsonii ATCC 33406]
MSPIIEQYILEAVKSFDTISEERKSVLKKISAYVQKKVSEGKAAELIYICTHNSRRSHLGQIWAKVAATYYGFNNVETYSGGTEATAFNPNAIKAIETIGFTVTNEDGKPNAVYSVQFGDAKIVIECFSKKYDDKANPKQGFCAVMTCTEADGACPYIDGAEVRVSTPYNDPKAFDETPHQDAKYLERSKQIATECLYVFSQIN